MRTVVVEPRTAVITLLFTDIEGSTRLWAEQPEKMARALSHHDALLRSAVQASRGSIVKSTGDGIFAVFDDPLDGLRAAVAMQRSLADPDRTGGLLLRIRCGVHAGAVECRDGDYFGNAVNRAARLMGAAHGGQIVASQDLRELVGAAATSVVSFIDLGSVRLRDVPTPTRVFQVVHPELRREFPPLRSTEGTPNNLPKALSSFVARERELAEVQALLRSHPLVTVVGPGGIGKTRLLAQVARNLLNDFVDGVWWIELAPIADPRLVAEAVASVLRVKPDPGETVEQALVKYAGSRNCLLVLDNCEHLLRACADLVRSLLAAGKELRIAASSREDLRVGGERIYPLRALAVPRATAGEPEAIAALDAVRLFVDRARAGLPDFRVDAGNAHAVAAICQRVDGIPLAIELAAARVRSLPVQAIAERLVDRLSFLRNRDPSANPRQQTVRALIEWSYQLLPREEQLLLHRLAVFAGGCDLAAAEAIGGVGEVGQDEVLDVLSALVHKSMVDFDRERGRYGLLETVRQYALERLAQVQEEETTRARHVVFYRRLAEEADDKLLGAEQPMWLERLDGERENLLAAIAWTRRTPDLAQDGLRLVHALRIWLGRISAELALRLAEEALGARGAEEPTAARGQAAFTAGSMSYFTGRYELAQRYGQESLAIARAGADRHKESDALSLIGMAAIGLGEPATGLGYLSDALAIARTVHDPMRLHQALACLAEAYAASGDIDAAEPLYGEALQIAHRMRSADSIALMQVNLARINIDRGAGHRAGEMLRATLPFVSATEWSPFGQLFLTVATQCAVLREELPLAARWYGAVQALLSSYGRRREPADEASLAPVVGRMRSSLDPAVFATATSDGATLAYGVVMAEVRDWLQARPA